MTTVNGSTSPIVKASEEVIGVNVENTNGDNLGKIREIMLDKHSGVVKFVVLDFGGFLGIGNKLFAMPWEIFSFDAARDCFVISVSKEKLESLEGFDKDNWPNMAEATWGHSLYQQFDVKENVRAERSDWL